jgi:hypothetical protein
MADEDLGPTDSFIAGSVLCDRPRVQRHLGREPPAERATKLETDFTPTYDLGLSDSNRNRRQSADPAFRDNASRDGSDFELAGLCKGYADWIALKRAVSAGCPPTYFAADDHLSLCKGSNAARRRGPTRVDSGRDAMACFQVDEPRDAPGEGPV